jgi:hypothetical protein
MKSAQNDESSANPCKLDIGNNSLSNFVQPDLPGSPSTLSSTAESGPASSGQVADTPTAGATPVLSSRTAQRGRGDFSPAPGDNNTCSGASSSIAGADSDQSGHRSAESANTTDSSVAPYNVAADGPSACGPCETPLSPPAHRTRLQ